VKTVAIFAVVFFLAIFACNMWLARKNGGREGKK